MNAAILLVAALATADAPAPPLDATADDNASALQGKWEIVDLRRGDSKPGLGDDVWTFTGDTAETGRFRWRIVAGTTRLDRITSDGRICPGEYHIARDTLFWRLQDRDVLWRFTFRRVPK
jgi:hypothetical protein